MASLGNEDKAKAALLEIDAQEKFNVAIEKLQSILSNIVNGPAMILAQTLANIVSDAANLERIFTAIKLIIVGLGAMKLAGLIAQLGSAAIAAGLLSAGAITAASAITFGIGAIAIVAGIASMMGAFDDAKTKAETDAANAAKVKDGIIGSNGLVVGKYNKGQIQPIAQGLPEDNVIFTTNKPAPVNNNNNASVNIDALIKEQQKTNAYLEKQNNISATIANRTPTVQYDSYIAGKAADVNSYKVSSGFIV